MSLSDPSLSAYCLTWVSLTLDVGYLFTAVPAKCSHYTLPWTWGISSQPPLLSLDIGYLLLATLVVCSHHSWDVGLLLRASASGLGHWVAPLSCCPCPRTWGSSSRPFLCCPSLAFSAAAPDLRRRVIPLGRHPLGKGSSGLLSLTSDVG